MLDLALRPPVPAGLSYRKLVEVSKRKMPKRTMKKSKIANPMRLRADYVGEMLTDLEDFSEELTQWEEGFIYDMTERFGLYDLPLFSDGQVSKVEEIHGRYCK